MPSMSITIERTPLTLQWEGQDIQVEQLGIRLPFAENAREILPILRALHRRGEEPQEFLAKIIALCENREECRSNCVKPEQEAPLSPREREVLAEAAQGLTQKQIAAKLGIKIYTIAVGTEEGTLANGMMVQSEFDEPTLRKIAQLTGGEHFRATNMASFNKAFTSIGKLEKSEAKVQTVRHIEEYFMYFLVTGAALALLGLSLQVLKPTPAP